MAGLTASNYSDILKEDYQDRIVNQLEESNALLQKIEKTSEYIDGRYAYQPLAIGRNEGISYTDEDEEYSGPDFQKHDKATFKLRYVYLTLGVTGQVMALSQTNKGSFKRGLQNEVEGGLVDMRKDLNRMSWGDGTGVRALVNTKTVAALKSTALTIPIRNDVTNHWSRTGWLNANARVDFMQLKDATPAGTFLWSVNNTISARLNATQISIDTFFKNGASNVGLQTQSISIGVYRAGSRNKVPYGLAALVTTGNPPHGALNFGSIDRTAAGKDFWKAPVLTSAGLQPISQELLDSALDEADIACNEWPDCGMTSHPVARRIAGITLGDRRQRFGPMMVLDGGWKGVMWGEIPIYVDPDATKNVLYMLNTKYIVMHQNGPFAWIDEQNGVLVKVNRKDAWEATLRKYCNLAASRCNCNVGLFSLDPLSNAA